MLGASLNQPAQAIIFLTGGLLSYLLYEFVSAFKGVPPHKESHAAARKAFKPAEFFTDILSVLIAGAVYIALSHFYFDGVMKAYMLLCFVVGGAIARLLFMEPFRKLSYFITARIKQKLRAFLKKCRAFLHKSRNNVQAKAKGAKLKHEQRKNNAKQRKQHKLQSKKPPGGAKIRPKKNFSRPNSNDAGNDRGGNASRHIKNRKHRNAKHRGDKALHQGQNL